METFNKYWKLITSVGVVIIGVVGWIFTQGANSKALDGRVFDSPEQKVSVVKYVEESPSPEQKQRSYLLDSLDKVSAIKTRAKRLEMQKSSDSTRAVHDSLFLDMVQRQTVQIEQIKAKLEQ